jgi:hypothetical protein
MPDRIGAFVTARSGTMIARCIDHWLMPAAWEDWMSVLRTLGVIGVVGALITPVGCGGSSSTPTAPTYTNYTDVFSDGVLLSGATVANPDFGLAGSPHRFTVHDGSSTYPGSISVTIGFLSPTSNILVGIGLTTWNATNQACDLPLPFTTYTGSLGVTVTASVGSPGDYCVALFDVGNVVGSSNYTVTVGHT